MMTDPIADMLTRIRNALMIRSSRTDMPHSRVKEGIAQILKREGFIHDYRVLGEPPRRKTLRVYLRYGPAGTSVIRRIQRESKPGRRVYEGVETIRPVLRGQGIAIYSTSRGLKTDRECRKERIGGEKLCTVW